MLHRRAIEVGGLYLLRQPQLYLVHVARAQLSSADLDIDRKIFPVGLSGIQCRAAFYRHGHRLSDPSCYSASFCVCGVLLFLNNDLSVTGRAVLVAFALLTPSILTSFGGLIFTERNVILWLACLLLCVKCFEQTGSTVWAVLAVLSGQLMIYYKEVGFLLLLGFAAGRLIFRCKKARAAGWDWNLLRNKESLLDICLGSLGVLFLVYYRLVMLPYPKVLYGDEGRLSIGDALLTYSKMALLIWLLLVVAVTRIYLIIRCRQSASPLWDGLATGGIAYLAAYLDLGFFTNYFLAPVDFIAVLYLGRLLMLSYETFSPWTKIGWLMLVLVVLVQQALFSSFCLFERKNTVHGKAELGGAIQARYQTNPADVRRLFFRLQMQQQ
jgi:hypothetical protein